MTKSFSFVCFMVLNSLACGPVPHPLKIEAKKYEVYFQNTTGSPEILAISTTFSLSCPSVYNGSGVFAQNPLPIGGTSGSIQVLQNIDCSLTITSFNDGTSTFNPSASPLVISISAAGVITSSGSIANPPVYTSSGNAHVYLFLASSTSSSLTFIYTVDPVAQSFAFVPLMGQ